MDRAESTLEQVERVLKRLKDGRYPSRGKANEMLEEIRRLMMDYRGSTSSLGPAWKPVAPPEPEQEPVTPPEPMANGNRRCAMPGCTTLISRYNPDDYCSVCGPRRAAA